MPQSSAFHSRAAVFAPPALAPASPAYVLSLSANCRCQVRTVLRVYHSVLSLPSLYRKIGSGKLRRGGAKGARRVSMNDASRGRPRMSLSCVGERVVRYVLC